MIFTNAGHNPPIILRKDDQVERMKDGGIVLGFQPNINFKQKEFEFNAGDIILMYTDGITEAMNEQEEEFGEERLIEVLKKIVICRFMSSGKKLFRRFNSLVTKRI